MSIVKMQIFVVFVKYMHYFFHTFIICFFFFTAYSNYPFYNTIFIKNQQNTRFSLNSKNVYVG